MFAHRLRIPGKCAVPLRKMAQATLFSFVITLWLYTICTVNGNTFSNTWAVKIRGDRVVLEKLARKHGFVNETQVGDDLTHSCRHLTEGEFKLI